MRDIVRIAKRCVLYASAYITTVPTRKRVGSTHLFFITMLLKIAIEFRTQCHDCIEPMTSSHAAKAKRRGVRGRERIVLDKKEGGEDEGRIGKTLY